jgi:hypothetical protein
VYKIICTFVLNRSFYEIPEKFLKWFVPPVAAIIALMYIFDVDYLIKAVRVVYLHGKQPPIWMTIPILITVPFTTVRHSLG